jgi:hypothetical protein
MTIWRNTVKNSPRCGNRNATQGQHRGSTGAGRWWEKHRRSVGTTWTTSVTSVLIVGLVLVLVLLLELSTCDMFSIRFAAAANLCRHVVSVSMNSYSLASPLTRRKLLKLKTWLNPNSSFEEREASGRTHNDAQTLPDCPSGSDATGPNASAEAISAALLQTIFFVCPLNEPYQASTLAAWNLVSGKS